MRFLRVPRKHLRTGLFVRAAAIGAALTGCAGLLLPSPAAAAGFPRENDDALSERAQCRHENDAFYVPRDAQGEWFWWYCRDAQYSGMRGDGFRPLSNDQREHGRVNQDQPKHWEDWMAKYANATGLVDFGKLGQEPCDVFDAHSGDLEPRQCARLKILQPRQSVCDQWWDLIKLLQNERDRTDIQPLDTAKDGRLVAQCRADQAKLQKAYAPLKIEDPNLYNRYDFTAPDEIEGPIDDVLDIGQWVVLVLGVFGVLICAGTLTVAYKDGTEEAAMGIVVVLGGVSLATSAAAVAAILLTG